MKTMKKLIPALAMLLVSAVLLGTSTFAWFSMNTSVKATGMQVQAKAEAGLVISNDAGGTYDATAASAKSTVAQLYPGSTKDLSTWLHSVSTNPASANTQQSYTTGSAWAADPGYGNYVVHDFYIRSSSAEELTITSLDVTSVTATVSSASPANNLSKALRVGVKFDGSSNIKIYAPVTGFTTTVSVQNEAGAYSSESSARTDVTAVNGSTLFNDTSVTSLPNNTQQGKHVYVYVWFEGEDAACISNNIIASLETLSIEVTFAYNTPST